RQVYNGRVFYGKDAFEGLRTMETLIEGKRTGNLDPDFGRAPGGRVLPPRKSQRETAAVDPASIPARSAVATDNTVFKPPFLGSRVAKGIPLDDIAAYLNETALFRNQWQSIADFFRPASSGEAAYAAFHVVTMSDVASAHSAKLFAANQYQDYLYFHGLSVEMAEALAEYWHHRIRDEWGFADEDGPTLGGLFKQQYRGSRYSWGYPACPDLDDQVKVAELLDMH